MSNFGKFADYITDSVRPVQQNSRHTWYYQVLLI